MDRRPQELLDAFAVVRAHGYTPIRVTTHLMTGADHGLRHRVRITTDEKTYTSDQFLSCWVLSSSVNPQGLHDNHRRLAWERACEALGAEMGVFG